MRSVRGSTRGWQLLRAKNKNNSKRTPKGRKGPMALYALRNDKLAKLGFADYEDYLRSDLWKEIRSEKLEKYPNCIICFKLADQVHHLRYDVDTLMGLACHNLVQICRDCHHRIEFNGERKRSLEEVNEVLFHEALKTRRGKRWSLWVESQIAKNKKNRPNSGRKR